MNSSSIILLVLALFATTSSSSSSSSSSSARESSESNRQLESEPIIEFAGARNRSISATSGHANSFKRGAELTGKEEEDLETAAGTNVLRPLFVYRRQLAYRKRRAKTKGGRRGARSPRTIGS